MNDEQRKAAVGGAEPEQAEEAPPGSRLAAEVAVDADEASGPRAENDDADEVGAGRSANDNAEGANSRSKLDRASRRIGENWALGVDTVAASRVGRWFKRVERPGAVDWALLIAVSALAFVTFLYGDIRATFEHSFNFLDAVFAGRPQDFYQIGIANNSFGHPAVYDVPIYAVFALWNLPTYLINQVSEFDYLSSWGALLWLKSMLVVFMLVSTWLIMRIARELGVSKTRSKWVAFYFLSSLTVFVPVLVVVQYDIISITFMLAGVLAYMKGRTRSFLGWFLLANTLKLFSVFIFIPLILLREKRLPRALAQIVVGLLGLFACRLLYGGNVGYQISTGGFTEEMIERLEASGFDWVLGLKVPIFIVFMVGLAIFAYVKRPSSEREVRAFAVYLPLSAFLTFCALVPLNPYWVALVAPFAVLIIFANPRHLTLNSLLEVSFGSSIFLIYMMVGYSMYNSLLFKYLLTGRLVPPAEQQRFADPGALLAQLGLNDLVGYLIGFMVACVIAVLVLNYPSADFILRMPNTEPIKRGVVWLRLTALAAFCGLMFAMYLWPAAPVVYSAATSTPTLTTADLTAPGVVVEEVLEFDRTLTVDTVQVGLDAQAVTWINLSTLKVSILDSDGEVVFEDYAAANAVKVGLTPFETDGLVLEEGESYTLRLVADGNRANEPVFVEVNPAVDQFETTQNGETVDGDLVLVLNGTPEQ